MRAETFAEIQARLGWGNRVLGLVLGSATRSVEDWRGGRRPIEGPVAILMLLLDGLKACRLEDGLLLLRLGDLEQAKPRKKRGPNKKGPAAGRRSCEAKGEEE